MRPDSEFEGACPQLALLSTPSLISPIPSISTACSGRPFWTGGEAGASSSSASRSSRSSLLCRRLKTRRWSWGGWEQGPSGSPVPPAQAPVLRSLVLAVTPALGLPTPYPVRTQPRLGSLRPSSPQACCLHLELDSALWSVRFPPAAVASHPSFLAHHFCPSPCPLAQPCPAAAQNRSVW